MSFPRVGWVPRPDEEPDEEEEGHLEVPRLRRIDVDAQLAPDQLMSPAGVRRERHRTRVKPRLGFRYQRFEDLQVTEAWYGADGRPSLRPGPLARLRHGEHALRERTRRPPRGAGLRRPRQAHPHRAGPLAGRALRPGRARPHGARSGGDALAPVDQAIRAELAQGSQVDPDGTDFVAFLGRDPTLGQLRVVSGRAAAAVCMQPEGRPVDPTQRLLIERARPNGDVGPRYVAEAAGRTRQGRLIGLRRRIGMALPHHPDTAASGLHRSIALDLALREPAPDPDAVSAAADALRVWLDTHAEPQPTTPLAKAARFGQERWPGELSPVDPRGRLRDDPLDRRPEPALCWHLPLGLTIRTATILSTVVLSCQQAGLRPWTWLRDALHAAAHGDLGDGSRWTPRSRRG